MAVAASRAAKNRGYLTEAKLGGLPNAELKPNSADYLIVQEAHGRMQGRVSVQMMIWLLAISAVGCFSNSEVRTVRAPLVPFVELFSPPDTLRLDPTVIIGHIGFLDLNARGEILLTDHSANSVHLYSPSGSYVRSYSARECLPDNTSFYPWSSRFIGGNRIMTMRFAGGAAVFDADGTCFAGKRALMPYVKAFCAHNDSIIAQQIHFEEEATVNAYSPELETLGEVFIEPPRLKNLNEYFAGQRGRTIDCFDDGAYFVYAESMDATPVDSTLSVTQHKPDFFEWRPDDLPDDMLDQSSDDQDRLFEAYPSAIAVFALNGSTRMVVHSYLDSKWSISDNRTSVEYGLGLSVVSNSGQFPARSTIPPVYPQAAGGGFLYAVGEHESLPNGEFGNPVILRFRFMPPQAER